MPYIEAEDLVPSTIAIYGRVNTSPPINVTEDHFADSFTMGLGVLDDHKLSHVPGTVNGRRQETFPKLTLQRLSQSVRR